MLALGFCTFATALGPLHHGSSSGPGVPARPPAQPQLVHECTLIPHPSGEMEPWLQSWVHPQRNFRLGGGPEPAQGFLLGCEIQPLWHRLVGHDVLPGAEASTLLKGHLLLNAPECSMPGGGKVQGAGPQEGGQGKPGEQEGP